MANSMREASKIEWSSNDSISEINAGSLQRIADATEKMASNYTSLQNSLDNYKRWYGDEQKENESLRRRISALKGVITKLKTT